MGELFASIGARLGVRVRIVKIDLTVEARHLDCVTCEVQDGNTVG